MSNSAWDSLHNRFGILSDVNIVRALEGFVAVADCESFTRAAEDLGVAQPHLSRTIRELERHLGAQLFDRYRRQITLTAAGRRLLPEARDLTDRLAALPNLATAAQGPLRLGVPPFADATAVPAVAADLHVGTRSVTLTPVDSSSCAAEVEKGGLDAALVLSGWGATDAFGSEATEWIVPLVAATPRFAGADGLPLPVGSLRGMPALLSGHSPGPPESERIILLPADAGLREDPAALSHLIASGISLRQLTPVAHEFDAITHVSTHGSTLLCPAAVARRHGLPFRPLRPVSLGRTVRLISSPRLDLREVFATETPLRSALLTVIDATRELDDLTWRTPRDRQFPPTDERLYPI
ncbi:LysR family transcriptional regulator [Brevibacterium luteolum]|uniref:LysR family transcriptional regulator n=1 Tax=Brevibacterium luteolum TaxID=199591 RepID=A0A6G8KYJ3_9MICO|nr:LysR family transcriptional regulator [Brevibacterium luteolum]QIN29884.1 LysR family transcriptional regulator [Brevibacterium luteolum]